ncbi:hypothetical protein [Ralstonia phage RP13]|nr:hypothetical protein [Ralstonia phage RP13]
MKNKLLISLAGMPGAGKDEFVKAVLASKLRELSPIILSNSDKIRDIAVLLCNLDPTRMNDQDYKASVQPGTYGKTVREILILIGDGLRGVISPEVNISPTLWSDIAMRRFTLGGDGLYIKKDDRRIEEYDATLAAGGYLIYIVNTKKQANLGDAADQAYQEYAKSKAHYIIENNMDEQFYKDAEDVVRKILVKEYAEILTV